MELYICFRKREQTSLLFIRDVDSTVGIKPKRRNSDDKIMTTFREVITMMDIFGFMGYNFVRDIEFNKDSSNMDDLLYYRCEIPEGDPLLKLFQTLNGDDL